MQQLSLALTRGGVSNPFAAYDLDGESAALVMDTEAGLYGLDNVSKAIAEVVTLTRASTATYVNSSGVLTSAAVDEIRIDHDPSTLAVRGMSVEPAETNLAIESNDPSTATWSNTKMTVTELVAGEFGYCANLRAWKSEITGDGINARLYDNNVGTETSGFHSLKVLVKGGTVTDIVIAESGFTNNEACVIDTTDGTLTPSGAGTAVWTAKELVGTNEWEVTMAGAVAGVDTVGNIQVSVSNGNAGNYFYFGGIMWVDAATIGSYIPTSGSTATRAKDIPDTATSAFAFSATEGTIVAEFEVPLIADQVIWSLDNSTANERIYLSRTGAGAITLNVVDGGVVQAAVVGATETGNGPFTVVCTWSAGDFNITVDGAAIVNDAAGTLPTVDTLGYAMDSAEANQAGGALKNLSYYAAQISDSAAVVRSGE